MDGREAQAALDAARRSDEWLAGNARWPLWRHAAFGLVEALIVGSWAVPQSLAAVLILVGVGGIFWIMHDDKERYGFFINGWSSEAARPATLGAVALVMGALAYIGLTGPIFEWRPEGLLAALVVFVGCTAASLWWQLLWQRDIGARDNG